MIFVHYVNNTSEEILGAKAVYLLHYITCV